MLTDTPGPAIGLAVKGEIVMPHTPICVSGNDGPEWFGSQNPANPDHEWLCDECGGVISTVEAGLPVDPTVADVFEALANHWPSWERRKSQ